MMQAYKTQIYRFWTDFVPEMKMVDGKPRATGELKAKDKVEYGPPGQGDRSRTVDYVSQLLKPMPRDDSNMNPTLRLANDRADYIRTHYEAWKKGQDIPENGTPIAAWNAITPEQAEVYKMKGIRTVEEIAEMSEGTWMKFPLPNMRRTVQDAKLFLKAKDQSAVAINMKRMEEENAALKAEMEEFRKLLKANDKTGEPEPLSATPNYDAVVAQQKKRGPGRPRKAA